MKNMKYVIFDDNGEMIPTVFASCFNHKKVADFFKGQIKNKDAEIISAGFVVLQKGEIKCFHRSDSLNIESRGEKDAEIIEEFL